MAGFRDDGGKFSMLTEETYFWASVMSDDNSSYYKTVSQSNGNVGQGFVENEFGYSVRCIKGLPVHKTDNSVVIDTTIYTLISDSIMLSQGIYQYEYNKKHKAEAIIIGDAIIGITDDSRNRR